MRVYATAEDLDEWDQWEPPIESPERLLRAASALVEDATLTAIYSTDRDGYPVDPAVRDAFRDATCAQAAQWHRLGIDPDQGAAGVTRQAQVTGKSIGSASLSYATPGRATDDMAAAATQLAPLAATILSGALPRSRVQVTG